ncbi:IS4 family transposase [Petroclostridium sp. X23]|uniref:IS4 family transposase n=1 Tax=Petroclostridium sp. X23 TaxID=3045146 RepID=UPI0024AD63C4|nr:IS4 family transposase [Petroclostridium sp. X23]WHH60689.1 IS4 family transposase [Petroclostridium sp. X23]
MFQVPISLIISFICFLGKTKILEISKDTGFTVRRSKLLPDTIVKVFTFGLWDTPNPSLRQTASKCENIQRGLSITREGLFQRLATSALLLKQVFQSAVEYSAKRAITVQNLDVLQAFTDVKICDSSKVTLPDKLADVWKGLGGNNAKAALKIQTIYSLKSRTITNMELTKAPGPDAGYKDELLKHIHHGELLITDLGYYSKDLFRKIISKGAYFLSRIKSNTVFQIQNSDTKSFKALDLLSVLKNSSSVDIDVYFGTKYSKLLQCRLIGVRLPDEVANERRRKANKKAKSQGKTLSDYDLELLGWNLLITNAPAHMLTPKAACELYRARWQIELLFKACKSYLNLGKVGNCGKEQLECLLYGRLIAIILIFTVYSALYALMYQQKNRCISMMSFIKLIATKVEKIFSSLYATTEAIPELRLILKRAAEQSLHDKRNRKTTVERLQEHYLLN